MFKQFEVQDEDERIIAGWCSVEIKDLQGDIVPVDELEKAMYKFMDRGGYIIYGHQNKPVGKVLRWEVKEHPELKRPGLWIVAKIHRGYAVDDAVWDMIKQGKLKGFSIGGAGKVKTKLVKENGTQKEIKYIGDIQLMEISIVEKPANPYATIEHVNYFAKGEVDEMKILTIEKGDDGFYGVTTDGDRVLVAKTVEELTKFLKDLRVKDIVKSLAKRGVNVDAEDFAIALEVAEYCDVCKGIVEEYMEEVADLLYGAKISELNDMQLQTVRQMGEKVKEIIALTLSIDKRDDNYNDFGAPISPVPTSNIIEEIVVEKAVNSKQDLIRILTGILNEAKKIRGFVHENTDSGAYRGMADDIVNTLGALIDEVREGVIEVSKEDIKKEKKDMKSRYTEESGRFKVMTCPDDPQKKSRFCGCVRYFMSQRNMSLESAKRMCAYIKRYVKKSGQYTATEVYDLVAEIAKSVEKEECNRLRDIVANIIYGKKYDDLTDDEKTKIHNAIVAVRRRSVGIDTAYTKTKDDIMKAIDAAWESYIKVKGLEKKVEELRKELVEIAKPGDVRPPKCISEDTFVVTKRGLVKATELSKDDEILTFNMETGELEYQKPLGIEIMDYEGKMIEYNGARFNQKVTPEHEFVCRWMKRKKWFKRDYSQIKYAKDYLEIPLTGEWKGADSVSLELPEGNGHCKPITIDNIDDFVRFCAWVIAEGSIHHNEKTRNYTISIVQSEPKNKEVGELLERLGFGYSKYLVYEKGTEKNIKGRIITTNSDCYVYVIQSKVLYEYFKKHCYEGKEKRIPQFIKDLDSERIRMFLEEYIKADGTISNGKRVIYVKGERLRDDLIELGLKAGYSVSYKQDKRDGVWRIYLKKAKTGRFRGEFKEVDYKGRIVAIKTENSTIVIARDGKISVTGNSWWDRCMDELNNARLCGWIYYHHLKPKKPESKSEPDKPETVAARRRKKKWLERKDNE